MKVSAVRIVFIEVPAEFEAKFNLWYDSDHVPEMCSRRDILGARRYYADDSTLKFRADHLEGAPPIGSARFCTVYLLGGEDYEGMSARDSEFRSRIPAERWLPSYAKATYSSTQRIVHASGASRISVSADARPYVGHLALQLAMGNVTDPARTPEVAQWWETKQYPQMLSVPGWVVALRCEPIGDSTPGRFMHLFLLDAPALDAHSALEEALPKWRAVGSSTHPYYRRVFSAPFSLLGPFGTRIAGCGSV
jgi:hypothetical protein